jgi:DNA-binding Lrp family transcriptional regulator
MYSAWIMINSETGKELSILDNLKKIPEVKESFQVYGIYDIVTRVEADSFRDLKIAISWKIRKIKNVRSTITMIVI